MITSLTIYEKELLVNKAIRSAIYNHLILHVDVPDGDNTCRLDMAVNEATKEIIKHLK